MFAELDSTTTGAHIDWQLLHALGVAMLCTLGAIASAYVGWKLVVLSRAGMEKERRMLAAKRARELEKRRQLKLQRLFPDAQLAAQTAAERVAGLERARDGIKGLFALVSVIAGIAVLLWLADLSSPRWRHQALGQTVTTIALVVCVLLVWFIHLCFGYFIKRAKERSNKCYQYLTRVTPCKHGIHGAKYGFINCANCKEEAIATDKAELAQIEAEKRRAEVEAAQLAAEKKRKRKEYFAGIRTTEFLKKMDPEKFETLVCSLFRKMGYEVQQTRYSRDGGVDAFLRKGGELSVLQVKRYGEGAVSVNEVRELYGVMHDKGAVQCVVVTTSKLSSDAKKFTHGKPFTIIELDKLVKLICTHFPEDGIVPSDFEQVEATGLKNTCPQCGSSMRQVKGRHGKFWGCSGYPKCRFTSKHA